MPVLGPLPLVFPAPLHIRTIRRVQSLTMSLLLSIRFPIPVVCWRFLLLHFVLVLILVLVDAQGWFIFTVRVVLILPLFRSRAVFQPPALLPVSADGCWGLRSGRSVAFSRNVFSEGLMLLLLTGMYLFDLSDFVPPCPVVDHSRLYQVVVVPPRRSLPLVLHKRRAHVHRLQARLHDLRRTVSVVCRWPVCRRLAFLRTQVQESRCSPPVGPAYHVVGHNFHHGSLADSLPILKIMADEDALRNIDVSYPWARLHLDERQLPPLSLLALFNLGNNLALQSLQVLRVLTLQEDWTILMPVRVLLSTFLPTMLTDVTLPRKLSGSPLLLRLRGFAV
mmetsp:Transcript_49893/g.156183  ORF Transcript_49893/g.156183 Transcript_49893/m.156183 type:complete len:335 (-) Transcript_49893:964-1968(-)